jgi:hypothetical protein
MPVNDPEARVYTSTGDRLTVLDGSTITADRAWTPHIQGRIEIAPPSVAMGPGKRVIVELTQRFGDISISRDLTTLFGDETGTLTEDFNGILPADMPALIAAGSWNDPPRAGTGRRLELMVTKVRERRDSWTLDVASAEALYLDALNPDLDGNNDAIARAIPGDHTQALVRFAFFSATTVGHHVAGGYPDLDEPVLITQARRAGVGAPLNVEPLANVWAAVVGILVSVAQRLYSRGDWALIHAEDNPPTPGDIIVEDGVNLIDYEYARDLATKTLVRWSGSQTDPNARPVWPTSIGGISFTNVVARLIDVPAPLIGWPPTDAPPPLGFPTPAASYATRAGLDLSPVRLTTPPDYSVMPWSSITYTLPGDDAVTTIIDAITWQLSGRFEMNIWA